MHYSLILRESLYASSDDWLEVPEIKKALSLAEEAGFTPGQMLHVLKKR